MDLQKDRSTDDRVVMKTWWTEEGYVQEIYHKSEKKHEETIIPFENMEEVLIGYSLIPLPNRDRQWFSADIYRVAAKIVIRYRETDKGHDFLLFLSETKEDLANWLQRIKKINAPAYVTKWDLYQVAPEDYRSDYESIEKEPYRNEEQLPDVLGTTKDHQENPVWRPPSFYKRRGNKRIIWDGQIKKLTFYLFLCHFFVSLFWMPFWRIDEEGSFSFMVLLYFIAILMIYVLFSYMRNDLPVYRSILDTLILGGPLFGGLLCAKLYTPVPSEMFFALYGDVMTFAVFLNGAFFLGRIPIAKKNKRSVTH
ncbi:hypothetical protein [Rossellomorea aquimaris]|uniref:hypothetical protein n=1 Tax=Rossellomorea aquimaris TaxID=189382 RepID=UPI001CFC7A1A|nr:hypothetical protein [Rossellomorea aquimaris]